MSSSTHQLSWDSANQSRFSSSSRQQSRRLRDLDCNKDSKVSKVSSESDDATIWSLKRSNFEPEMKVRKPSTQAYSQQLEL